MFFFFNDTATTEIYTLSLHDALPILWLCASDDRLGRARSSAVRCVRRRRGGLRSEEHTSELQSQSNLVCRLLLEKKKMTQPGDRTLDCIAACGLRRGSRLLCAIVALA